jgi:CheY-like chemotaxis protein
LTIGLHRYGYQVLSLNDPINALRIFGDGPDQWDLVVSDQVMPGMSGLKLIAKLKELRPDLRAILYTGFDEKIAAGSASLQDVDALLRKPLTPQKLAEQIRRIMDSSPPE